MSINLSKKTSRRTALKSIAGAGLALYAGASVSAADKMTLPAPPSGMGSERLAQDEAFWREVATYYDRTEGIINLEHGYWGKMASQCWKFISVLRRW